MRTVEDKELKRARLRRLRVIATGLLVAMCVVYAVARTFEPRFAWVGFIRAFAEAAMIGAMADWFAVVALFRHPLGLPIPHTAIVRRRQAEVGQGLGAFIVENFLTREVISRRLEQIDLTGATTAWLLEHTEAMVGRILEFVPRLLDAIDDKDIGRVVHTQLVERARSIPAAPALGQVLELLTAGDKHEVLLSQALQFGDSIVTANRKLIERGVEKELPIPKKVGPVSLAGVRHLVAAYVSRKVVGNLRDILHAIGDDPDHPLREEFAQRLAQFVENLKISTEYRARGEKIKEELLENSTLHDYAGSVWSHLKDAILADLARPESAIREHLVAMVKSIAGAIHEDAALRRKLNDGLRDAVVEFIEKNASDIGRLIEETVRSWDADDLIDKLELEVGGDLQFIRLNGTFIGGAIGIAIHLAELLIWR